MPSFVCRALSGMPIEVYGDGNQVSDMVWVGDLARTLVAALVTAMAGKAVPTVECGPVKHAMVNDVADTVAKTVATETGLMPVAVDHLPMRPGEIPGATVLADTSTLAAVGIDRDSFIPLEQGVSLTVKWFNEHEGITWNKA